MNLDGCLFHKPCAKCIDCNCQITLNNFVKNDPGESGEYILLCKTHHLKRFHEQGSYIGAEKYRIKAERDIHALTKDVSTTKSVGSAVTDDDAVSVTGSIGAVAVAASHVLTEEEQKVAPGSVKSIIAERRKSVAAAEAAKSSSPRMVTKSTKPAPAPID